MPGVLICSPPRPDRRLRGGLFAGLLRSSWGLDPISAGCPKAKAVRTADGAKDGLIGEKIGSKCCCTSFRRHKPLKKALDPTDIRILTEIQENASLTNVALAERVGLSPSPCLARVRTLEESGVIARRVTLLDVAKLGPSLSVFIHRIAPWILASSRNTCWHSNQ